MKTFTAQVVAMKTAVKDAVSEQRREGNVPRVDARVFVMHAFDEAWPPPKVPDDPTRTK